MLNYRNMLTTLLASLVAFSAQARSDRSERNDRTEVQADVSYSGSGCPQGSVSVSLAPDASAISVLYSNFTASVGGEGGPTKADVDCTVKIRLRGPRGWHADISNADFRGFLAIDQGVTVAQDVKFMLGHPGGKNRSFQRKVWSGPYMDDFVVSNVPAEREHVSCPKGNSDTKIKLRTDFRLAGGTANRLGFIAVDSFDGRVQPLEQRYRLAWKNCR